MNEVNGLEGNAPFGRIILTDIRNILIVVISQG
jgi:hypothetical protein